MLLVDIQTEMPEDGNQKQVRLEKRWGIYMLYESY
jgi:hypothetical protein